MCSIKALIAAFTVLLILDVLLFGRCCHAEESLFRGGDPKYLLVLAMAGGCSDFRLYLDLDSCDVISHDENGFEISAEYIATIAQANKGHKYVCRFRKNEESGWKLQVWNEDYDKEWVTFIDPHDEDTIKQILEEKGLVDFRLFDYYSFKCVYQHLFDEPYEDDFDDEKLRRTVINLPRDGEKWEIHNNLWNDENYPCVFRHPSGGAWYVDKSSVYVEMESPSQYILRILVFQTPQFHYNDMMMDTIFLYRFLYDKKIKKMYVWRWPSQKWMEAPPSQNSDNVDTMVRNIGRYAYALVYGDTLPFTEGS